jgi:hypothetical protein
MKRTLALVVLCLISASGAFAWNCSDPLASRVPVPSGTSGSFGNGDGQLFLGTGSEGTKGQLYQCQVPTPDPKSPSQNQSQTQSQSNQQSQNQTSSPSATSSASNSLANSGNSSNKNLNKNTNQNTATGGSANSASTSSSSATNNGNNANNSSYESNSQYNEVRQNPGAYAPTILNTSPCTKGFSGGGSTPAVAATFGVATTDKGCDSRQTAVIFHGLGNDFAAAKILCSTSASKRAKLTLQECLAIVAPPAPVVVVPPAPQPAPVSITVVPVPVPVAAVAPPVQIAVPAEKFSAGILTSSECRLVNGKLTNVCYRFLDDAVRRLEQNPNTTLKLKGPIEITTAVKYLKARVSGERIQYTFDDEQNNVVTIETWTEK